MIFLVKLKKKKSQSLCLWFKYFNAARPRTGKQNEL